MGGTCLVSIWLVAGPAELCRLSMMRISHAWLACVGRAPARKQTLVLVSSVKGPTAVLHGACSCDQQADWLCAGA